MNDHQSNGFTLLPPETPSLQRNLGEESEVSGTVLSTVPGTATGSSTGFATRTSAGFLPQPPVIDQSAVIVVTDDGAASQHTVAVMEKDGDAADAEAVGADASGKGSRPNRRGKMPARLTPDQRTRVLYLFAEAFRKEQRYLGAPDGCIMRAARIVAEQWKQESGVEHSVQAMAYVYRRQSTPIPERKPLKPRGRPSTVLTEERKKAVGQVIADPSIPLEMKTVRRIRALLPGDHGKIASSSISRIFKEIKKDKLLPKEQKASRNNKVKTTTTTPAPNAAIHVTSSMLVSFPDQRL